VIVRKSEYLETFLSRYEFHYGMVKRLVLLALNTGLRFGELHNLCWSRDSKSNYVDVRNKVLVIHSSKTKSGKPRYVHLNKNALEVILSIPRTQSRYLFCNPKTKKPIGSVSRSFGMALEFAGIRDFRFHDLRHTFASHVAMSGVNLYVLKDLLGHSTIKMTERYSHLSPQKSHEALDILGDNLYCVSSFRGTNRAQTQNLEVCQKVPTDVTSYITIGKN